MLVISLMITLTKIIRPWFQRRIHKVETTYGNPEKLQRDTLALLVGKSRRTLWGEEHQYSSIRDYEDFVKKVAITPYEQLRQLIMRMVGGESDILWPGVAKNFAQSSGTSDGKSKYIPITADSFNLSHYRGGADVVAHYLNLYRDSRIFDGKSFILGGSFANELALKPGVKVGDLSANLIDRINPAVNLVRIPDKKTALMADWSQKLPALAESALNENVTNISGVPSWFLTVLKEVIARAGATTIHDVWPNLEVFFHGGISFAPYREQYNHITDANKMRYLETYNASEGFFAVQSSRDDRSMLLLLDAGTFYEFQPTDSPDAPPVPCWEVKEGEIYSLIISSCNGLWRYPIGDTVKIESVKPLKITIAGRTKHYINAFGEEVMVYNTDAALAKACAATGAEALNYTAAPVYAGDKSKGRHQWLIEWAQRPESVDAFADALDKALQQENSDYQAKREGGIFLDRIEIVTAEPGLFDRWLASTGKLGGQRKVPRLCNDRRFIDPMLELLYSTNQSKIQTTLHGKSNPL